MKQKQFDTNIIFRTTLTLKDKFKQWCKDNNTTISKEFNNHMESIINNRPRLKDMKVETINGTYIGKGHPLHSYYVTDEQYDKFNTLYGSNVDNCNDEELKALCLEIKQANGNR